MELQTRARMLSASRQRSALSLVNASPTIGPVGHPTRRSHPRMMAGSMAQCLSSIPVSTPGLVTKSNTLLQATTLMAENH